MRITAQSQLGGSGMAAVPALGPGTCWSGAARSKGVHAYLIYISIVNLLTNNVQYSLVILQ